MGKTMAARHLRAFLQNFFYRTFDIFRGGGYAGEDDTV